MLTSSYEQEVAHATTASQTTPKPAHYLTGALAAVTKVDFGRRECSSRAGGDGYFIAMLVTSTR